jgi:hypothetical protein
MSWAMSVFNSNFGLMSTVLSVKVMKLSAQTFSDALTVSVNRIDSMANLDTSTL